MSQPSARTIFVREDGWRTGAKLKASVKTELLRRLTQRDVSILTMLAEFHYLTTDQLAAFYFPSRRAAQIRLAWMRSQKLVLRFAQFVPLMGGRKRLPSVFLLTERGAAVLAGCQKLPADPLIKRSWAAAQYVLHLSHALGAIGFFANLATASRDLPDEGLYLWIGEDTLRAIYKRDKSDLAPDGHGVYIANGQTVGFHLEWDHGTESHSRLEEKGKAYDRASGTPYVLWVVPTAHRENSLRGAIEKMDDALTTTTALLREHGPLGPVWLPVPGEDAPRLALTELPMRPTSTLSVHDCVGKPEWWERRLGGSARN